ncbi:MAG: hypothetical protein MK180_15820 [Rhodobacteraceae bacterium]|nr:hypothetical protein [Paracoccaceae bacterium]
MDSTLDWRSDPVVTIEQDLTPVMVSAPTLLCRIAMGRREEDKISNWRDAAEALCRLLLTSFDERLVPAGIALSSGDRIVCHRAGRAMTDFTRVLTRLRPGEQTETSRALYQFETGVLPKVDAAFDTVMRVIVTDTMRRQADQALAVHVALTETDPALRSAEARAIVPPQATRADLDAALPAASLFECATKIPK